MNARVLMRLACILTGMSVLIMTGAEIAAAVRDTSGLCIECHSKTASLKEGRSTHRPVREGKCTACHNPHASKHSGLLADPGSALCYNCHESKGFKAAVVHRPVEKGECLSCHNAHSSGNEVLLKEAGGKVCFLCHPYEKIAPWKNVHPEVKKGNCTACHSPHSSQFSGLLARPGKALCAGCHGARGKAARPCVYNTVGADCTGCHSPHSSDRKALLKAALHKPFADKNCAGCHAQGASFQVRAGAALCIECHKPVMESFKRIYSHLTGGANSDACLSCHAPHASDEKHLFRAKEAQVCFACHGDTKEHVARSKHTHTGLGACSDCHVSHGSNYLFFLSKGPETCSTGKCHATQGRFTHPVGEKIIDPRSKSPMDCSTCHNPMGSSEEFSLRFEKDRELCVQCHQV